MAILTANLVPATPVRIPAPPPRTRPKPAFAAYDNYDDRKEIIRNLLGRLHPIRQVRWLEWCCQNSVMANNPNRPCVLPPTYRLMRAALKDDGAHRLTWDVVLTFVVLCNDYTLDPAKALAKLVEMARKEKS